MNAKMLLKRSLALLSACVCACFGMPDVKTAQAAE